MCSVVGLPNKKEEAYKKVYNILIKEFSFKPKMIKIDFQLLILIYLRILKTSLFYFVLVLLLFSKIIELSGKYK